MAARIGRQGRGSILTFDFFFRRKGPFFDEGGSVAAVLSHLCSGNSVVNHRESAERFINSGTSMYDKESSAISVPDPDSRIGSNAAFFLSFSFR